MRALIQGRGKIVRDGPQGPKTTWSSCYRPAALQGFEKLLANSKLERAELSEGDELD